MILFRRHFMIPPLCTTCVHQLLGEDTELNIENPWNCCLCFGLLDSTMIKDVAEEVRRKLDSECYESLSFKLAINFPVTCALRDEIFYEVFKTDVGSEHLKDISLKLRIVRSYLDALEVETKMKPTLDSDFTITVTFSNDEFYNSDYNFLRENLPEKLPNERKRKRRRNRRCRDIEIPVESLYTKVLVANLSKYLKGDIARNYKWNSPSDRCCISVAFDREPIYIAGRYCKYSRFLSQSPKNFGDLPQIIGNSVSEKLCGPLCQESGATSTRFIASGREDVDVRMLGNGRPFAIQVVQQLSSHFFPYIPPSKVQAGFIFFDLFSFCICRISILIPRFCYCLVLKIQLLNSKKISKFRGFELTKTLERVEAAINSEKDIKLGSHLQRITAEQADQLKKGEEEKRKIYTAYCYSTELLSDTALDALPSKCPLEIIQKTPVRVLRRRPLLDRSRMIYKLQILKLDDYYFIMRIEAQAGTYIKEFVHGDFGRTRPSVAELIECKHGEVDIIDLDVEKVDLDWPPEENKFQRISRASDLMRISL
ncbi:hypothetical protein AB6A40_009147 [Gnathostoma spinigerum]|uniref:tRNA pseudouridine(55) synthase n=1 Tax=Gnathostoma spinigerum TaxID=75299 RepID=A0ABD6EZA6_9BILA